MAFSSPIDFPTDTYGELTNLVPALVDALNGARMSRSKFVLLKTYLKQATDTLNKSVLKDLENFEVVELRLGTSEDTPEETTVVVPQENTATENAQDASSQAVQGNDITAEQKPATAPENTVSDEIVPLPASTPAEEAEEAAAAAEIAQAESEVAQQDVILKPV